MVFYGLIRTSGSRQDIVSQRMGLREWARENGHQLRYSFEDPGRSGQNDRRPGRERLMKCILKRPPPVDGVLVWSLDRLGRNPADLRRDLKIIQAAGLRLVSVTEPTLAPSNYAAHIRAIAAQSKATSRSVRRALQLQREHGGRAGLPPYGYKYKKVKVRL